MDFALIANHDAAMVTTRNSGDRTGPLTMLVGVVGVALAQLAGGAPIAAATVAIAWGATRAQSDQAARTRSLAVLAVYGMLALLAVAAQLELATRTFGAWRLVLTIDLALAAGGVVHLAQREVRR